MKKTYLAAIGLIALFIFGGVVYGALSSTEQNESKSVQQTSDSIKEKSKDVDLTLAELITHDSEEDCWMVIEDKVYDVTSYITTHPGGDEILRGCGRDATPYYQLRQDDEGNDIGSGLPHSQFADDILKDFELGSFKK